MVQIFHFSCVLLFYTVKITWWLLTISQNCIKSYLHLMQFAFVSSEVWWFSEKNDSTVSHILFCFWLTYVTQHEYTMIIDYFSYNAISFFPCGLVSILKATHHQPWPASHQSRDLVTRPWTQASQLMQFSPHLWLTCFPS